MMTVPSTGSNVVLPTDGSGHVGIQDSGGGGTLLQLGAAGGPPATTTFMLPETGYLFANGNATLKVTEWSPNRFLLENIAGQVDFIASAPGQVLGGLGNGTVRLTSLRSDTSVNVDVPQELGATPSIRSEGGVRIDVATGGNPVVEANLELGGKSGKTEFVSNGSVPIAIDTGQKNAKFELGRAAGDQNRASLSLKEGSASITVSEVGNSAIALGANGIAGLLRAQDKETSFHIAFGATAGQLCADIAGSSDMGFVSGRNGRLQLPAEACAATRAVADCRLYSGETSLFDRSGQLIKAWMGNEDRSGSGVGNRLTVPATRGLTIERAAPRLNAFSPRLGRTLISSLMVKLGETNLRLLGSADAYGRLLVSDGEVTLSVQPVGDVRLDLAPNKAQAETAGAIVLAWNGVAIEFVPAIADLAAWARHVEALSGQLRLRSDGSYLLELDGALYSLRPDWLVTQGTSTGMAMKGDQPESWADGEQRQQRLHAAVADLAALRAAVHSVLPAAGIEVAADGAVILRLPDTAIRLWPQSRLVEIPAQRRLDKWWQDEEGRIYLAIAGLQRAQVFTVAPVIADDR